MKTIVVKTETRYEVHIIEEFPGAIPEGQSERAYVESCIREAEMMHAGPIQRALPSIVRLEELGETVVKPKAMDHPIEHAKPPQRKK